MIQRVMKKNPIRIEHGSTVAMINRKNHDPVGSQYMRVNLRCRILDREKFRQNRINIEKMISGENAEIGIECFGAFGADDRIITISQIPESQWRDLYISETSLMHAAKLKEYGIMGIQTEVLEIERERSGEEAQPG